jgi:hypothetical protein
MPRKTDARGIIEVMTKSIGEHMRKFLRRTSVVTMWVSFLVLLGVHAYAAGSVPLITKEELKQILGDQKVTVIDVRVDGAWKSSSQKIKGAVREDFYDVKPWAAKYPKDRMIVLYCS